MLPLLACKRSGKSRRRQEQFMNKSPRPAVIEGCMRWRSADGYGPEAVGNVASLRAFTPCHPDGRARVLVAIGMARGARGDDELGARSEVQPADLDRARDRRAPEQYPWPPGAARARPHHGDLRPYRSGSRG